MVTENDLRKIFEPFGTLDYVNLHIDSATGRSKGFAFIQYYHLTRFSSSGDARQAIRHLNDYELMGKQIKVGPITEKDRHERRRESHLDEDEDVGNVSLNSLSRVELMAKLARDEVRTTGSGRRSETVAVAPANLETPCVVLKNMFDPEKYH